MTLTNEVTLAPDVTTRPYATAASQLLKFFSGSTP